MGSFNVGCGITNLSINEGDKTGFIILQKHRDYSKDFTPVRERPFQVYCTDNYLPLFPPVFGEYADYGNVDNIQASTTTKVLEDLFHIPIEKIIECIGSDRGVYYGDIAENYLLKTAKINDYGTTFSEKLTSIGFSVIEAGKYQFGDFILECESERSKFSIRTSEKILLADAFTHGGEYEMMDVFGHITKTYPGVDKKNWEAVRLLNSLTGMYFHPQALEDILAAQEKNTYEFEKQYTVRLKNNLNEFMEEFDKEREYDDILAKYPSAWMTRFNDTLRNIQFPPELYPILVNYKDSQEELLGIWDFIGVMTQVNRMIQPSYAGEQFQNEKMEKALLKSAQAILKQQKTRWEE